MEEKRLKLKELNKSRLFYREQERTASVEVVFNKSYTGKTPQQIKRIRKKIEKQIFKLIDEL